MTETTGTERASAAAREPRASRRAWLVVAYVVAAVAGYGIGVAGWLRGEKPESSALARVGYALRAENPRATAAEWERLRRDVSEVRDGWKPEDRDVFNLVVAVRGLENSGQANYQEAERLCHALGWPRCDRPALEALAQRARP